MYNKFLEFLLENDPKKVISPFGLRVRQIFNPAFNMIIPFKTPTKLQIVGRARMPKNRPVIFAATHGFKEDVDNSIMTIGRNAYILVGSLEQFFKTTDGILGWANGVILVDRLDKESRSASKEKMVHLIKMGGSILMFPEGTWNVSPNQLVAGIFPGIYDTAKESGALVAPVATIRHGEMVYSMLGKAFDITKYERTEGLKILRDKMATLKWRLMEEKTPVVKRKTLPVGAEADIYWRIQTDDLKDEVHFFEHELEEMSIYKHKDITHIEEAFDFMRRMLPHHKNAFLFRGSGGPFFHRGRG